MKKLYTILTAVIITASAFAQAPEKMSYQAVVRDAANALVTSSGIGMQLSILQDSVNGTAVYVETQTPTTNINGLVSIEIGSGTVVSGAFNTIDWSNGPYFIKTETDPTGGTTYTITGTSQLMSVPYAMHANTADSVIGAINETDPLFNTSIASGITAIDTSIWNSKLTVELDGNPTNELQMLSVVNDSLILSNGNAVQVPVRIHTLGEVYGGGKVFWVDPSGEHGLIVTTSNLSTGITFGCYGTNVYGASSTSYGEINSAIYAAECSGNNAASLCVNSVLNGYIDWYLPSEEELELLYQYNYPGMNGSYWSSTQTSDNGAVSIDFNNGTHYQTTSKQIAGGRKVRAIRKF